MQSSSLSKPLAEGQLRVQFLVSIVGLLLINDIRYETEGKRTVHAVALSMTKTSQPDEWICDFLHNLSTKIRIFYVIFKLRRQISCNFLCGYRLINVNSLRKCLIFYNEDTFQIVFVSVLLFVQADAAIYEAAEYFVAPQMWDNSQQLQTLTYNL